MVDARFSDLVVIRCRCGVQNCHQKLNLQVFFREDFWQLFRNFKKSQPIFGNFKKFFQNIFWPEIYEIFEDAMLSWS